MVTKESDDSCHQPPNDGLLGRPRTDECPLFCIVLPGSLLSVTQITEYRYFSRIKPIREFTYTSE